MRACITGLAFHGDMAVTYAYLLAGFLVTLYGVKTLRSGFSVFW
jgi:hypothetical protein